jgi:hypothetical protein
MMGFGLVIPSKSFYVETFGARGTALGMPMAGFRLV